MSQPAVLRTIRLRMSKLSKGTTQRSKSYRTVSYAYPICFAPQPVGLLLASLLPRRFPEAVVVPHSPCCVLEQLPSRL
jgi:hypothetical protein